jgi:zinc-ribbon domain
MSYLVYCPTCNAKISVNANQCPQCGEDKFIENIFVGYKEETIDCWKCRDQDVWENRYGKVRLSFSGYIRPTCIICDGSGKVIEKKPIYKRIDKRKRVE